LSARIKTQNPLFGQKQQNKSSNLWEDFVREFMRQYTRKCLDKNADISIALKIGNDITPQGDMDGDMCLRCSALPGQPAALSHGVFARSFQIFLTCVCPLEQRDSLDFSM
jgi:hypothetical protein